MPATPPDLRLTQFNFKGHLCIFCKQKLDTISALRCKTHYYKRLWRDGKGHGACVTCIEKVLTYERENYPYCGVSYDKVKEITSRDPSELIIRCYLCGSCLSESEKEKHKLTKEPFLLVRAYIRGRCYSCSSDGRRSIFDKGPSTEQQFK